jgi:uncharacterized protein with HEPN domain
MDERILKYIFDVKMAIEEIESYFQSFPKSFPEYQNNLVLKRAIERNLEIIGEAINRISKIDPTIQISNAQRIIGLRNQIIHGYDSISDENIWGVIIKHIPILKSEIEGLINSGRYLA